MTEISTKQMREIHAGYKEQIDQLEAQNAQLLAALEFYANDENWQSEIDGFGEFVLAYKMQADMGQIARQALAAAKGGE